MKIKVLVVDDSSFMRKVIGDILEEDPRINVVGRARDGLDALKKMTQFSPDVVTLDVEMSRMNGLQTLHEIMKRHPVPVIMVSSVTSEGAGATIKALAAGAVDFVAKPSGAISLDMGDVGEELRSKVIMAASARVIQEKGAKDMLSNGCRHLAPDKYMPFREVECPEIVAVASSTGGPQALQKLLSALPEDFPLPIVVAQHMPKGFTASFARRLNEISRLTVVEGEPHLPLCGGMAVIAPGGYHLLVKRDPRTRRLYCDLSDAPPLLSVKPSANILFMSVADAVGGRAIAAILTGMGKDGTEGAMVLHSKGAYIMAEAPETCVVYGMPRSVVEANIVHDQLPIQDIPAALMRCVNFTL